MPHSVKIISNAGSHTERIIQFSYSRDKGLYSIDKLNEELNALNAQLIHKGVKGELNVTLRTREARFPLRTPIPIGARNIRLERLHVFYDQLINDEQHFMQHTDLNVLTGMYVIVKQTNYRGK